MLDFISVPLVVGIVTLGIYKLFELFVRRKERLSIIEKMGDKFDPSLIETKLPIPSFNTSSVFTTLKLGSLLLGVGLGLLVGFFICQVYVYSSIPTIDINNDAYEISGIIYGATVMLFGGLGLVTAFLIEMKMQKK